MDIEAAIGALEEHYRGFRRGRTAQRNNKNYRHRLDFHRCLCAEEDPNYRFREFVAECEVCRSGYCVGVNTRRNLIVCGYDTYHKRTGTRICRPPE